MQILRPFGPMIGKWHLDDNIYKSLLQITDDVLADKNRENVGDKLAGEIKEQNLIPINVLEESNVLNYFLKCSLMYIEEILQPMLTPDVDDIPDISVAMTTCWVNSMYKHEWNPPHVHALDLSSVIILKVPNDIKPPEGILSFTNGSYRLPQEFEKGTQGFLPEVGDFYLFPARLHHTVNPFSCEGERRTVSFNIEKRFTDNKK